MQSGTQNLSTSGQATVTSGIITPQLKQTLFSAQNQQHQLSLSRDGMGWVMA